MSRAAKSTHVEMGMHRAEVRSTRQVSPRLRRITLAGESLRDFRDDGPDQRFKLLLPQPTQAQPVLPAFTPDWYQEWLAMAQDVRPVMRTYTIRAARPEHGEVDVDIVVHGDHGPGSRWALNASPGDQVGVFGAYAEYDADPSARQLIAGDHTALPAISAILEQLPAEARATALIEVPDAEDELDLDRPPEAEVIWVHAADGNPGAALAEAVTRLPGGDETFDYAWVAAERKAVPQIRRHLIAERGLRPEQIMFMGYWRADGAIDDIGAGE